MSEKQGTNYPFSLDRPPVPPKIPTVNGLDCPACGHPTLVLGNGGYITCALEGCPNPDYQEALEQRDARRARIAERTGEVSQLKFLKHWAVLHGISITVDDLDHFLKSIELLPDQPLARENLAALGVTLADIAAKDMKPEAKALVQDAAERVAEAQDAVSKPVPEEVEKIRSEFGATLANFGVQGEQHSRLLKALMLTLNPVLAYHRQATIKEVVEKAEEVFADLNGSGAHACYCPRSTDGGCKCALKDEYIAQWRAALKKITEEMS